MPLKKSSTHTLAKSLAKSSRPRSQAPPSQSGARNFRALLEPDHTSLKWTIARVPFSCSAAWPHMLRRRVAGTINGVPFRTSLFPAPPGSPLIQGHPGAVVLVNKEMQAAAHVFVGDHADLTLWPDLEERPADLPPELLDAFEGDEILHHWTLALSDSNRREIAKWIGAVKSPDSRAKRAAQMAERLLLAMEGELQTPPILENLFHANPRARTAWLALTPTQRRNHLLGIFYYQTPEARTRRAGKAVEDALRLQDRH